MHQPSGVRNFTLIELLVVIAIIAILAGILMPALSSALQKAKIISCTGNQKQIAFGLSNYASDNREWFPEQGYSDTMTTHFWHRALLVNGYISRSMTEAESYDNDKRGTTVLLCPEDTPPYYSASSNPAAQRDYLSYAINGKISWSNVGSSPNAHYIPRSLLAKGRRCNNPNHEGIIRKSLSEIALTTGNFKSTGFQPWASKENSPWDPNYPRCQISSRHKIGAVLSFADGHIGLQKFPFPADCLNPESALTF